MNDNENIDAELHNLWDTVADKLDKMGNLTMDDVSKWLLGGWWRWITTCLKQMMKLLLKQLKQVEGKEEGVAATTVHTVGHDMAVGSKKWHVCFYNSCVEKTSRKSIKSVVSS